MELDLGGTLIFFLVYAGMLFGNWPGLALDRTGIALLGAIAFIGIQNIPIYEAASYIDLSALAILFSFMVISAQFYYSGFYTNIVDRMQKWRFSPSHLLLVVILISGLLSAILLNDIVCLALAPLIIRGCNNKKLNPLPYLLGLACGSNIGSGLTLIGNPQNLLIGQSLSIPFAQYLKYSLVPCLFGLAATWYTIKFYTKTNWFKENQEIDFKAIPFDFWQSIKGVILILILLVMFFFFNVPHDHISLIAAGFLLLSRRMTSQKMLSFIDWQLLILFIGLFIVNRAFLNTGALDSFIVLLNHYQIDIHTPFWLFLIAILLSNVVSNVPAVMLLLPFVKTHFTGSLLAIASTLAGNMFIVGSIANLIVITQAAQYGIKINWKSHLRVGLPITLITLIIAAIWLYLITVFETST